MPRDAIQLIVQGRVQGVGFRWWTVETARRLGLDGWVRNLGDGSVEILAVGQSETLGQLELQCRSGPPGAQVTTVARRDAKDDGASGFHQKPTA